jgi:hypothetical protein
MGIANDPVRWSLTNGHVGGIRMMNGDPEEGLIGAPTLEADGLSKVGRRYQSVETLLFSQLPDDPGARRVFESQETRKRTLFESSSPFCTWRLRVRLELNGIDISQIRDASVVFVLRGQHSEALADARMQALRQRELASGPDERALAFSLRDLVPQAITDLREGKAAHFNVLPRMALGDGVLQVIDDYAVDLRLTSIAAVVVLKGRPASAAANLELAIGIPRDSDAPPAVVMVTTDASGGVRSEATPALAAVTGEGSLPIGAFSIAMTKNGDQLSNGLASPRDIQDVGLLLRYSYRRGTLRGH